MERIYLDHAATTPMDQRSHRNNDSEAMNEVFGNPSSIHSFGRKATKTH